MANESQANTTTDIWHREFCPRMRNRKLKITLFYILNILPILMSLIGGHIIVSRPYLFQTSVDIGLPAPVLIIIALVAAIGTILATWMVIFLPRRLGYKRTLGLLLILSYQPMILIGQLIHTKREALTQQDYLTLWWPRTSISLVLTLVLIGLAIYLASKVAKKQNLDNVSTSVCLLGAKD